ncbi:MBL fold metallo-hydrolase [Halovivax gelatinilyticus]|uniref:MBL fold metallo-hydrolase n=1 Tax=Halovivax gelatinilyticus TaxID=2961597 RepID=UPI0020CA597A|nr:MBL fold metallo-hydrolase [Halovivax gelatinilyticus]
MIENLASGVRAFTSNAFLVDGSRTVLVDAGSNFDVVSAIEDRSDRLDAVVLTHTHPDHVGNVPAVASAFDVEVWGYDSTVDGVDRELTDGEEVTLGEDDYVVVHTPGHKDDHVCLYAADPGILFAGDLVFQNGGFGRTDLPEGDRATLVASIDRVLETVDPALREMHVGHGPSVTTDPYDHIELAGRTAREL